MMIKTKIMMMVMMKMMKMEGVQAILDSSQMTTIMMLLKHCMAHMIAIQVSRYIMGLFEQKAKLCSKLCS